MSNAKMELKIARAELLMSRLYAGTLGFDLLPELSRLTGERLNNLRIEWFVNRK